ncbi:MAG: hypothetical protein SWY16_21070 [Cyanobacteriota bacterium]|nr:hypothetical protein [Cyanobacteriota bacterium]
MRAIDFATSVRVRGIIQIQQVLSHFKGVYLNPFSQGLDSERV